MERAFVLQGAETVNEYLKPGDVVLTRGRSLISRLIRLCTRRLGETRTRVNHVGIVVQRGGLLEVEMIEALERVRRHPLAKRYAGSGDEVAVYRCRPLTELQRLKIADCALDFEGRKYGYLKIALHLGDWILQGAYVFRRLGRMKRYPICSWLVAHAYARGYRPGRSFGVKPGAASPDDIWDHVTGRPDEWEQIRALAPLPAHDRRYPGGTPARPAWPPAPAPPAKR